MKRIQFSALAFFLFCLASCDEDQTARQDRQHSCCVGEDPVLMGSWLLTEYGYSPGAGYIIKPVSSIPRQQITFGSDSTLETTVESLKDYRFYTLSADTTSGKKVVIFYKKYPQPQVEDSAISYDVEISDDHKVLRLHFRWCVEGCHLGFKSIE